MEVYQIKLKRKNDGSIELSTSKAILRMEGQGHMPKFKVGDKVKVVRILDGGLTLKERFLNDILTIRELNPNNKYHTTPAGRHYGVVEKPADIYVWFEDELELVEEKEKPFTKADLKPGMIVEYRDGEKALYINGIFMSEGSWMNDTDYKEDLTYLRTKNNSRLDICKIYSSKAFVSTKLFDSNCMELLWERKDEAKEMTVAEIEKELGYKVKIVDGE